MRRNRILRRVQHAESSNVNLIQFCSTPSEQMSTLPIIPYRAVSNASITIPVISLLTVKNPAADNSFDAIAWSLSHSQTVFESTLPPLLPVIKGETLMPPFRQSNRAAGEFDGYKHIITEVGGGRGLSLVGSWDARGCLRNRDAAKLLRRTYEKFRSKIISKLLIHINPI